MYDDLILTPNKTQIYLTTESFESSGSLYYYDIVKNNKIRKGSNSLKGAKEIYKDTAYKGWFNTPKSYIITSFVYNNELFHLYNNNDNKTISIAKIENGNLIPIQEIAKDISVFNDSYSYRMKIQRDGSQLLKFQTNNPDLFGFMEINGNKINFHYMKHDVDSVNYIGTDAFSTIFDFIYSNIDSLPLFAVDSLEKQAEGIDIMGFRKGALHESYYPNKNKLEFEGAKKYLKIENSMITNYTEYFFTKKDSLVKTVFLEWIETKLYNNDDDLFNRNNINKINAFKEKVTEIENYVSKKLNTSPTRKEKSGNRFELNWEGTNGIIVNLYGSDFESKREIRMVIYKE